MKKLAEAAMKKASEVAAPIKSASGKVTTAAKGVADAAVGQVNSVAMSVENRYHKTTDAIENAKASIVNTGKTIAGASFVLLEAGAVIAPFVLPVPAVIGVAILSFLAYSIVGSVQENIDEGERLKAQRLANIIKRYGKIPETAQVKTDYLDISINSKTGEVSGKVRQEGKVWVDLGELSPADIQSLKSNICCPESEALLDALLALRSASSTKA